MTAWETQVASLSPRYWYKLDETSPTTIANSGAATTGTLTKLGASGAIVSNSGGKSNNYFSFPYGNNATTGQGRYTLTGFESIFADKIYSVETWFRQNGTIYSNSTQHTFLALTASTQSLTLSIPGPGQYQANKLAVNYIGGSNSDGLGSTNNVNDNQWHHVVVTSNGNSVKVYLDGSQIGTTLTTSVGTFNPNTVSFGADSRTPGTGCFLGDMDEVVIYNAELTAAQVAANYASANSVAASYTAAGMTVSNATLPMPAFATTTVINASYASATLTASATAVDATSSGSANLDGFGVIGTASADIVNPSVSVIKNVNYIDGIMTASALYTSATISTQKNINPSASPMTASALLSSNVYFGPTIQDSSYNLLLRQISNTTNTEAKNGFVIGSQYSGSNLDSKTSLLLRNSNGVPPFGSVIKAKFDPAHLTVSGGTDVSPSNTFNIYVFTEAPASWTTFTYANLPAKELIQTSRLVDDASSNQFHLDITTAANDSRAYTYGIFIEHVGTPPYAATQYDRTEFNGTGLDVKLMYILTSDFASKNINASPMTVSALQTDVTISLQRYVDVSATPLAASGLAVNPTIDAISAALVEPLAVTASVVMVQPAFARSANYVSDHLEAHSEMLLHAASVTANVSNAATPFLTSGTAVMPEAHIGEDQFVAPFLASVTFVHPTIIFNTEVKAATTNTVSADMMMPQVDTQLRGIIYAEPMRARNAIFQTPPSYVNIFSDPWYKTMYDFLIPKTFAGQGKLLKVFEDVTTNKTSGTLNNNITLEMWNNGTVIDAGNPTMKIEADYGTTEDPSLIEVGYFDNYNRKAVRIKNSSFQYYSGYGSDRNDFSMQFSIKTTKADQILASGTYFSQYSYGSWSSTFNLVNGRLNTLTYPASTLYHPKNLAANLADYGTDELTGFKRIDDGEWHYVTIQLSQGRLQYWIDGELDWQRFGTFIQHPRKIGANVPNLTYAPDFQTSATFVNCHLIYSQRDLLLQHFDYQRYKPVKPAVSFASADMGQGTTAKGNRKRALMLYFWTNGPGVLAQSNANRGFDSGVGGEFDGPTFDPALTTMDYYTAGPQQYFGWDVFPVDINGYYVSDLVKESAYGGARNIAITKMGFAGSGEQGPKDTFRINRRGYFRDPKTDIRRYIDLVKDIDLSNFDSIFFANYPDQSREVDAFAKNEIVDDYFAIRETVIFHDFIKSLRAAVDTGISLYVTNHQLAIDLGIVDRVEVVSDLKDTGYYYQDPYSPTIAPSDATTLPAGGVGNAAGWKDWVRNNRTRIVNTLPGLTDSSCIVTNNRLFWANDDQLDFGGPDHSFVSYEIKPFGLTIGDEFMMSTAKDGQRNYLAAPFSAVKAGTIISAFATHQRRGLDLVPNPYSEHAQSIALQPGDVLNGKQLGGKIFVNFTEELANSGDWGQAELIQDKWINLAYANGAISLSAKNAYLNASYNLDRQRESGKISQAQYDRDAYWSYNGMHILGQVNKFESTFMVDQLQAAQSGTMQKTAAGTEASTSGLQVYQKQLWFTFKYSNQYPVVQLVVDSMLTKGFRWLSNRLEASPEVQRPLAIEASASMPDARISGDRTTTINVAAMSASARLTEGQGYSPKDATFNPLPMTAFAEITNKVTKIDSAPMLATARLREDVAVLVSSIDEIILYVMHEDPILYLREDIIK